MDELGKILDTSVADVLAGLRLPPLPALPTLPAIDGLPTLPPLNLDLILKPLTDLLGSFGTGNLSAAQVDPSKVLSVLSQLLESSLSMGSAAFRALDGLWSGTAATSATAKTTKTGAETTALATQGSGMSIDIGAAATIVATGLATVQGIVVKTVGLLVSTLPLITTPVGQGIALGFLTTGLAEGAAAVAATRAQLLGPTTHMAANGAPVKISGAPASSTTSPFAVAANLLDAIGTPVKAMSTSLTQLLSTVTSTTASPNQKTPTSTNTKGDNETKCGEDRGDDKSPASTRPAALGGSGQISPGVVPAAPLSARPSTASITTEPASATTAPSSPRVALPTASALPGVMAPMAAAGVRSGSGSAAGTVADHLISQANGARLVGDVDPDAAPAVIGDAQPELSAADIDLSLIEVQFDPSLRL
ncbi:hypothetical protein GOEFS_096_00990 [Gordonia effusa NBRC 100432]|uniref:Uncharacterized protein n=1 Tax=Gordonia effusa NBRC 100432 TaxID=1077974 RepID=H0R4C1_9ACTN|nr:hypothetical protein [Gordonia effusa]GAB19922.1 hypothetical protein GOEFS_096_00990 [Gordonia effusa NBRC 100432]